MKNTNFLKLAETDLKKLSALRSEKCLYELERKFEEKWIAVGRKLFQDLVGDPGNDRCVKKKYLAALER